MALYSLVPGLFLPYLNMGTCNFIVGLQLPDRRMGEGDAMQTCGNSRGIMGLVKQRG
jgi:hypothetical protein